MTAAEIRDAMEECVKAPTDKAAALFLCEIAAQLAELNQQLRDLSDNYLGKAALAITTRSNDSVVVVEGGQ